MAWTYEMDRFDSGDVADPRPVMRVFNGLAGEMNGHWDRDNVPSQILTKDKLAAKAIIAVGNTTNDTPVTTLPPGQSGGWSTVDIATTTITCDYDGALRVSASLNHYVTLDPTLIRYNDKYQFRMMINGQQVAISGWYASAHTRTSCRLVGLSSVSSGSTVVTIQARAWAAPFVYLSNITNGIGLSAAYSSNRSSTTHDLYVVRCSVSYTFRKR